MRRVRHLIDLGRGYPPRLLGFALPTVAVGLPLVVGAVAHIVGGVRPTPHIVVAVVVFFLLALAAELRPVPLDVEGEWLVSYAFVFVVSGVLILGWAWGTLIGTASIFFAQLPVRPGLLRLSFNSAVYAVAAGLAAIPELASPLGAHSNLGLVIGLAFLSGAGFVAANVVLVCGAIGLASGQPVRKVMDDHLRHSGPAFTVMVFVVGQAVLVWRQSPYLLPLVGAPLFALNLYQRAAIKRRAAEVEAARDNLTGLGNQRAYEETIAAITGAGHEGSLILYLLDVDRFKQVNDRHGHPTGDAVLAKLGELVEELAPGVGYRIGGDEFAVLFAGDDPAVQTFPDRLRDGLAALTVAGVTEPVTISVGAAHFPEHAHDASSLKRRADLALYKSKRNGKDRTSVFQPQEPLFTGDGDTEGDTGSMVAVRRLLAALAARHGNVGTHSTAVADLARSIGRTLGVEDAELDHLYLAGLLHDLGKISTPDAILLKPGPLTVEERAVMQDHAQIGFHLLDGLDLTPVDNWILHHHEHWDGTGYPDGLAGGEIPFGSRIVLVADAFDAMTTERPYRRALSVQAALGELRDLSGRQFDPLVVSALETCLAADPDRVHADTFV